MMTAAFVMDAGRHHQSLFWLRANIYSLGTQQVMAAVASTSVLQQCVHTL